MEKIMLSDAVPGKTVDQKEGEFQWNGQRMILADLPGSYSLSAGSDEEIITKDYIASGNADLVLVMADASQLKRSLYMLADFVGTQIPVVPMSAIRKKDYTLLYDTIEQSLQKKPILLGSTLTSAKEKMHFIDTLLDGVLETSKTASNAFTKFDKTALSPVKGKLLAFGIILGIFLLAMIFAGVISGIASAILVPVAAALRTIFANLNVPALLISLVCDVLMNVLYFAFMMASFVLRHCLSFPRLPLLCLEAPADFSSSCRSSCLCSS